MADLLIRQTLFQSQFAKLSRYTVLGSVPDRKGRLGANFYQLLVVEMCRNTCKSRDETLQLLQNHSISHHTDSQRSSISFRVICGKNVVYYLTTLSANQIISFLLG